jgi:hypothetical protein
VIKGKRVHDYTIQKYTTKYGFWKTTEQYSLVATSAMGSMSLCHSGFGGNGRVHSKFKNGSSKNLQCVETQLFFLPQSIAQSLLLLEW